MTVRGIRGATTVLSDNTDEVLAATSELLEHLQRANLFAPEDIASILFTVTRDIKSAFPAKAARLMGWAMVPVICFQEIEVAGSLPLCIRALILLNTDQRQDQIQHIYLREAESLRRDLKPK